MSLNPICFMKLFNLLLSVLPLIICTSHITYCVSLNYIILYANCYFFALMSCVQLGHKSYGKRIISLYVSSIMYIHESIIIVLLKKKLNAQVDLRIIY